MAPSTVATLTDATNAALTPQALAGIKAQFAPLGTLQSLTLRDRRTVKGMEVFHYQGAFSSGQTIPLTMAVDKDGKIAGFG